MLKILHTADWHVGQTLAGYGRLDEHRIALRELVAIAVEEAIDALILAGDVFDTQSPKAEAETLVYETIAALARALPKATLVVVAGNHDLAQRIEAPSPLYRAFGVHAVGSIRRKDGLIDLDRHLVALPDANGVIRAHCLALPYPRAIDLPGLALGGDENAGSGIVREVRRLYAEATAAAKDRIGDLPLLATGHLHVQGSIESEGAERAILVGGQHAAPADVFPPELAYVALGHLHRRQAIGRETIRYAGSLLPLSATERGYEHGVTLVSLVDGRVEVSHRPIRRPAPFLRVPDRGSLPVVEIEQALRALPLDPATPENLRPFVQLSIRLDGPAPGLEAELDRLAQSLPIRFVGHVVERPDTGLAGLEAIAEDRQPLATRDPAELFAAAFQATHGVPPDAAHKAVFDAALMASEPD
jgi:exonuclease SbcD